MRELALHILDIAENSLAANADQINITIEEDLLGDILNIYIQDNGRGMDPDIVARITDPFITSRQTRKVGLGIPFFKAAAEACDGTFNITSEPGQGTTVAATFKHSHIDRMPLGNMAGTILSLIIGTPEVHWIYQHQVNQNTFEFDTQPVKEILNGVPLSEPAVMKYIRETLEEGIHNVRCNHDTELMYSK